MGSNPGLTLFLLQFLSKTLPGSVRPCYIYFLIMIQTDCNTMEATVEHIDIEKGCCSRVNKKKKIIQIFTLLSTLWMFGTK